MELQPDNASLRQLRVQRLCYCPELIPLNDNGLVHCTPGEPLPLPECDTCPLLMREDEIPPRLRRRRKPTQQAQEKPAPALEETVSVEEVQEEPSPEDTDTDTDTDTNADAETETEETNGVETVMTEPIDDEDDEVLLPAERTAENEEES